MPLNGLRLFRGSQRLWPRSGVIILKKSKYSEEEIKIAKRLWDNGMYYLARDKDERLFAYSKPVMKSSSEWLIYDVSSPWRIDRQDSVFFKNICFEDTEPTYIGDILGYPLPFNESYYLREVMKLFKREDSKSICKKYRFGQLCLIIYGERSFPYAIISIEDDQFKNMDINYEYKLEELGI